MANKHRAFGLDAELEAKKAAKYDKDLEVQALNWIRDLTGKERAEEQSVHEFLKDGAVLCELMNTLLPGAIPRVNTSKMAFKQMENIQNFLLAAEKYGVPRSDMFQTVDLFEDKNMGQVIICIYALGREAQRNGKFDGPVIGVKPSEKNVREFDEEKLNAGKFVATQQMGYNKGASQAGMTAPGMRREIDHLSHHKLRTGGQ